MLVFVGWYGRGNCGDEAFKDVHEMLFPTHEKVWVDDRADMSSVPKSALYVLGGGDVVSDFYVHKIPPNQKFFMYGVGLASLEQRDYVASMRDRLLGVWVRNTEDAAALAGVGVPARFTPDIVFQLSEAVGACDTSRLPRAGERKMLLVFPSNNGPEAAARQRDLGAYHYYEFMIAEMAKTLDYIGKYYDIMFVPLSSNENDNDIIWAMRTSSLMKNKNNVTVLDRHLTPIEVAALTSRANMVMSMKFHGLIFALLAGRPFVNIGLTRKTQLLCEDNDLSHLCVPRHSFSYDRVLRCLKAAEAPDALAAVTDVSARLRASAKSEGSLFAQQVETALREVELQRA